MIIVKTDEELARMRESGRVAASIREAVARAVAPGVTTRELADYAAELMRAAGAQSAFLGYRGFPGVICVSVNDCVVHGIPGDRRIEVGDIVSLDIGVRYAGFVTDTATTVMVGVTDPTVVRLVTVTRQALEAGIRMARAGGRVSDISHGVQQEVERHGFSVVRAFVGHGIGREMHEEPQVPNFGAPGRGALLRRGMTLAIEPMVNAGGVEVETQSDGWTVLTKDRTLSAHFEHTVAVREGDPEILTA